MTHPFEIELETTLPASPERVWEAIATGPGIDSWFMGRNEVEPREGGVAAMDTGGRREEAVITAYEPGKRLATRTATAGDGRFMAFEYLIEGRDGGSTVLRVVHSGLLGDNWQDEYDALRRGWPFHLHTLREYLTHFPGRAGVPVFAVAPSGGQPAQDKFGRHGFENFREYVRVEHDHLVSFGGQRTPSRGRTPSRRTCRRWTARWSGRTTSASRYAPPTGSTPSTASPAWC